MPPIEGLLTRKTELPPTGTGQRQGLDQTPDQQPDWRTSIHPQALPGSRARTETSRCVAHVFGARRSAPTHGAQVFVG